MKQILATLALIALALSFASCDKTCNCNCSCCNTNGSDQTIQRPDNSGSGSGNNGGTTDDNIGGNAGENEGTTDGIDRSDYTVYNNTMTQGQAGYYGNYYSDQGQSSNIANWYVELAEDDYNFETSVGDGYNVVLEFFSNGSSYTSSLQEGTYTVAETDKGVFNNYSVLFGYLVEDEEEEVTYALGTWLWEGADALAGATAGNMTITESGNIYTINYTFYDDEYQITFKGSFTGSLAFYDGTQEVTSVSAAKNFAPSKSFPAPKIDNPVRHYRIRK